MIRYVDTTTPLIDVRLFIFQKRYSADNEQQLTKKLFGHLLYDLKSTLNRRIYSLDYSLSLFIKLREFKHRPGIHRYISVYYYYF